MYRRCGRAWEWFRFWDFESGPRREAALRIERHADQRTDNLKAHLLRRRTGRRRWWRRRQRCGIDRQRSRLLGQFEPFVVERHIVGAGWEVGQLDFALGRRLQEKRLRLSGADSRPKEWPEILSHDPHRFGLLLDRLRRFDRRDHRGRSLEEQEGAVGKRDETEQQDAYQGVDQIHQSEQAS